MTKLTVFMAALVLSISACADTDQWSAWLGRADAHLDAANPTGLATLHVELNADTQQQPRTMRVVEAWLAPPGQPTHALALALPGDHVTVPATMASTRYVLDNRGVTNAELAPWCQSSAPLQVQVDFPVGGNTQIVLDAELAVFCP